MSDDTDNLGLELSKVLFRAEPTLLACDLDASARAAARVSNLLGCILSFVLMKQGPEAYYEALKVVMENVNKTAFKTANKAVKMADEPPSVN